MPWAVKELYSHRLGAAPYDFKGAGLDLTSSHLIPKYES